MQKECIFKVVDSDDYLEKSAYRKLIATLKVLIQQKHYVDMVFTNYVYENIKTKKQKIMSYNKVEKRQDYDLEEQNAYWYFRIYIDAFNCLQNKIVKEYRITFARTYLL